MKPYVVCHMLTSIDGKIDGSCGMSGSHMADTVKESRHSADDFFIFSASGTSDFAYSAFKSQIMSMANDSDGFFRLAKSEAVGNLSFLEREGYAHDEKTTEEYTYNGLCFFWNKD